MNKMTLPALALILFCSTAYAAEQAAAPAPAPAPAAAPAKPASDCATLEKKYDAADKTKVTADKLKKANAKREEGDKQCAAGKTADGVKSLKSALKTIGIKHS
jgi:hypothetical protein